MSNIYLRVKASFVAVEGSPGSLYPQISSTTTGLPGGAGDLLSSSCHQSKDRYATEPNKCCIRAVSIIVTVTVCHGTGTLCYGNNIMLPYVSLSYGTLL